MTDQVDQLERACEQADMKAHYLYEEHMHTLEQAEAEKDRQEDEALLADEVEKCLHGVCPICFRLGIFPDCMSEVPAC